MSVLEINDLKRKRAKALNEARTILERAESEGRDLHADEERQWTDWNNEIDRLGKQIDRTEQLRSMQDKLKDNGEGEFRTNPGQFENRQANKDGLDSEEYRDSWNNYLRVNREGMDMDEIRTLSKGTNSAGGYTVPTHMSDKLVQALNEINIMRQLATVIQTSSDEQIPVVTSHGTAAWTGENQPSTASDEEFGQKNLGAYKATTLIKISEELLNDSAFDLEAYIINEFARRIGTLEEAAFVNGDGTGKPTGIVGQSTLGKTGAAGQTTSVTGDDLIDLYHSLKRPYRKAASWLMNDVTVKAIRKLKDVDNNYLWQPGLKAGQPDTILGNTVNVATDMPQMAASAKSILFGDYSYYWIGDRGGRSIQRLNELYAENGQVGFRGYQRTDGILTLGEAVKHYANSAT